MQQNDFYESPKNSILGYIMPLLISLLYVIVLGALQSLIPYQLFFMAFLSSYLIGRYMLKYLEYYTTFHKILAAIYGLISYIVFLFSYIFFLYLKIGVSAVDAFKLIFSIDGLKVVFSFIKGFNVIYIIITPIASYCYLEYKGR